MRIALIGYGKMGKAIEEIAVKRGHSIGLVINTGNSDQLNSDNLRHCDVAIEFTNPHSAVQNLQHCLDASIPVVCGSTGWLQQWETIKNYCTEKKGALLYASNFSIGVNIFFELNKKLASLMASQNQYNILLEEIHHTAKKDAPSGTAITLAEQITERHPIKKTWINEPTEAPELLPVISRRIDPAPGTHHVKYFSEVDDIEIIHTAHNRSGFATGAVLAAEFIHNKKGIFSMRDVLNIT